MEKRTFNRLGLGLLGMSLMTIFMQVLIMLVLRLAFPAALGYDGLSYLLIAAFYLFGVPVFWLITRRLPVSKPVEKRPVTLGSTLTLFLISFGILILFSMLGNLAATLIGLLRGAPVNDAVSSLLESPSYFWILLIVCFCSPIVEEFLFRGLLLDRLRPFGDRVAILYSGIAFGLFHMDLRQLCYAIPLGMVFAYITLRTGSIRQTVLLHMLVNFFGSFLTLFLQDKLGTAGLLLYLGFALAAVVFAVVWLAVHHRGLRLDGARFSFSRPITARLVCLNPGSVLYAVFCAGMLLFNLLFTA